MPNHYDIDVHCAGCNKYLYSITPSGRYRDGPEYCAKCKKEQLKEIKKTQIRMMAKFLQGWSDYYKEATKCLKTKKKN